MVVSDSGDCVFKDNAIALLCQWDDRPIFLSSGRKPSRLQGRYRLVNFFRVGIVRAVRVKPDPAIFVQTGWVRLDENTMFKTIGLMLFGKAPLPAMVAMPRVSAKVTKFGNDGDIDEVGLVPVLDAEQLLQPHRALLIQVNELAGVSDAAFKMFYQPVIHTLLREINMKLTNIKLTGLSAGILLVCASFGVYSGESHMAEALKHAEAAAKSADGKAVDAVVKHAQAAKEHADVAKEHLDAGITSLNDAIDHGKMKHADLAKKSADEAVTHLKAAQ